MCRNKEQPSTVKDITTLSGISSDNSETLSIDFISTEFEYSDSDITEFEFDDSDSDLTEFEFDDSDSDLTEFEFDDSNSTESECHCFNCKSYVGFTDESIHPDIHAFDEDANNQNIVQPNRYQNVLDFLEANVSEDSLLQPGEFEGAYGPVAPDDKREVSPPVKASKPVIFEILDFDFVEKWRNFRTPPKDEKMNNVWEHWSQFPGADPVSLDGSERKKRREEHLKVCLDEVSNNFSSQQRTVLSRGDDLDKFREEGIYDSWNCSHSFGAIAIGPERKKRREENLKKKATAADINGNVCSAGLGVHDAATEDKENHSKEL